MPFTEKLHNCWSEDSKRLFVSTSPFGKQTYLYPQEAGFFRTEFPYSAERCDYNSFFILVTLAGKGILEYEGNRYELTPSTLAFIDCMPRHRYYAPESGGKWEFYWVHFHGVSARGYYTQFRRDNASPLLVLPKEASPQDAIQELISLEESAGPRKEPIASLLLTKLLTDALCFSFSRNLPSGAVPSYLLHVAEEMDKRFAEPLTLRDFAAKYYVNESYLSREFKRHFGVSPKQYLVNRRLREAKDYLKYSDLPISEIALLSGFSSDNYFIRAFKKQEKISPLSFRKSCR